MSDVDSYVADLDENSKAIVKALRKFLHSDFPKLEEEYKWKQAVYTFNAKNVAYIAATKAGANFGLVNGAILNDPNKLLVGTGKLMRHIKIPDPDSIDTRYLADLINQAMAK